MVPPSLCLVIYTAPLPAPEAAVFPAAADTPAAAGTPVAVRPLVLASYCRRLDVAIARLVDYCSSSSTNACQLPITLPHMYIA